MLAFVAENCNLVYTFYCDHMVILALSIYTFRGHYLLETHSGNLRKNHRICLGMNCPANPSGNLGSEFGTDHVSLQYLSIQTQ